MALNRLRILLALEKNNNARVHSAVCTNAKSSRAHLSKREHSFTTSFTENFYKTAAQIPNVSHSNLQHTVELFSDIAGDRHARCNHCAVYSVRIVPLLLSRCDCKCNIRSGSGKLKLECDSLSFCLPTLEIKSLNKMLLGLSLEDTSPCVTADVSLAKYNSGGDLGIIIQAPPRTYPTEQKRSLSPSSRTGQNFKTIPLFHQLS